MDYTRLSLIYRTKQNGQLAVTPGVVARNMSSCDTLRSFPQVKNGMK